jgi:trehalose 2-sulfotransferase
MVPRLSYIICCSRRSGSWLLAGGLEDTKVAGHPSEWFNDQEEAVWCERWGLPYPIENYRLYLDKVIEAGCAGTDIFGLKLLGYHFRDLEKKFRTIPKFRDLPIGQIIPAAFPNTRYIWLTRKDKERQAISYYRARHSGVWFDMEGHSTSGNPAPLKFDADEIWRGENELKGFEKLWQDYFRDSSLTPLKLEYEYLAENYEKTIRNVLEYIGVEDTKKIKISQPRFKKQANAITEEWAQQYRDYKARNGLS